MKRLTPEEEEDRRYGRRLKVGERCRLEPEETSPVYRVARVTPGAAYLTRRLTPKPVTFNAGLPNERTASMAGEEFFAVSARARVWLLPEVEEE